jgi:hypothetical protein
VDDMDYEELEEIAYDDPDYFEKRKRLKQIVLSKTNPHPLHYPGRHKGDSEQAWFDKNPHYYSKHPMAGLTWDLDKCSRCGISRIYHRTKKERVLGRIYFALFCVVSIILVGLLGWGLSEILPDPKPHISDHQKCINDDGTWVRGQYSDDNYCILDGRVK